MQSFGQKLELYLLLDFANYWSSFVIRAVLLDELADQKGGQIHSKPPLSCFRGVSLQAALQKRTS